MSIAIASRTIVDDNGCHVWQGAKTHDGYGQMWDGTTTVYVHRWVWEQANGPLPSGLAVDHICFNSSCVRVEHLRALDSLENARRQRSALKKHCKHGHEFTAANTYRRPSDNRRQCKTCKVETTRRWRAREAS